MLRTEGAAGTADDIFDDREKSYEAQYKMDEERRFKAASRRNKLLGLWVAERMGLSGTAADEYAKEVVVADLETPGEDDVVDKVMKDLEGKDTGITEAQVRKEMERLYAVALDQIMNEFPTALDKDHEQVGG